MGTNTTPDYERGLTFEKVWASIQELRKSQAETDRMLKENAERWEQEAKRREEETKRDAQMIANWKADFNRMVRRSNKQLGELHPRFGQMAEHLVTRHICRRFNELGYDFRYYTSKLDGQKIYDEYGKVKAEVSMVLENGETIMAVDVETHPKVKDVELHIRHLEIVREFRSKINDKRKIQGAIAGVIFGTAEKKATVEAGLYVIEQSGDTMKIDVPEGFVPREW